jgi:parallel beta-helix repeat protein
MRRRRLVEFTLMSAMMCVAPSAWAQCLVSTPPLPAGTEVGNTLYVAPNGNDSGSCPSSAPCRTLTYAIVQMRDGDALYVKSGTYNEWVGGDGGNRPQIPDRTLIAAETPGTVTVQGIDLGNASDVVVDGFITHGLYFGSSEGSHNRIQNTEVAGTPNDSGVYGDAPYSELINLNVHHAAVDSNGESLCHLGSPTPGLCHGVYSTADHLLIEGGEYHHNEGWGLHLYLGPTNQTVRHVCSHHNGGTGIGFLGGAGGNTAYENTVWNNDVGFWVSAGNTIYDNIVYGNASVDIIAEPGSTVYGNVDDQGNLVLLSQ